MVKIRVWAIVLLSVLLLANGEIFSQTKEQREAIEEYLKNAGKGSSGIIEQDLSDIYKEKKPVTPPLDTVQGGRSDKVSRFGLDMFAHPPEDFVSSTEIPVPPDYTLGPGDQLIVNLWGRVDMGMQLLIDREGKVFIPKAGELVLWGMTLAEAEKRIENVLSTIYSDFKMNLILGKIRSITVYIGGEVKRPGAYTVSSLYTLFNTLYLAGGPTERGTLRNIRLIRNSKTVKEVDLYRLLMEGLSEDVRLESNDIIFVPVVGPLVTVVGEVRRPGVYEIRGGERLMSAIELAGGTCSSAYLGKIDVRRFEDNTRRVLIDLDISRLDAGCEDNIILKDGDVVRIGAVHDLAERIVFLEGEVKYPGEYEYFEGMKVSDLIDPENLLPHSYIKGVLLIRIFRDNTKKVFTIDLEPIIASYGIRLFTEGFHGSGMLENGSEGYYMDDVVKCDMELKPWDRLVVYHVDRMKDKEYVDIYGEVRIPGRYEFTEDMTLSDLIFMAGGVRKRACLLNAELARMNPDSTGLSIVTRIKLEDRAKQLQNRADLKLDPGDAIFVRERPEYKDHEKVWIGGEVMFPGTYVIESDDESIASLIERAGGFTEEAFLMGAVFQRNGIVEELEYRHVEDVVNALRQSYIDTAGIQRMEKLRIEMNPEKINRVIIDLPKIMRHRDPKDDIVLRAGDRIFIPKVPSGITVLGAVASSGTIKYDPKKKVQYYIDKAGGLTRKAAKGETRILKADGRVVKKRVMSQTVELGDAIIVPEKVLRERDWMRIFQTSMSIIASALTTVIIVTKL